MKNQLIRLRIDDLHPDGNGIGRTEDGMVVFVSLTVPGDVCEVLIIKETSNYLIGKLQTLLTPSPHRIPAACPAFRRCGSCSFLHLSEDFENELKRSYVKNAFLRIAHLDVPVEETRSFSMERYRNKVIYPLSSQDGILTFGYYARHSHSVVPHEDCLLQDRRFSAIASQFCIEAQELNVSAWDSASGTGVLRHLMLRKNRKGLFSVTIAASSRFPEQKTLSDRLMSKFSEIRGVSLNIQPRPDNVILGEETILLGGQSSLDDCMCGNTYSISPVSFYQIHTECAEQMYATAALLLDLHPDDILLDLYCGVGTIGLSIAGRDLYLVGVEIVPKAVEDALDNAIRNGRSKKNTLFVCGDAATGLTACKNTFGSPSAIIVDPPRKGLSNEVVQAIIDSSCPKLLYISCDPASLAKNCSSFVSAGYSIQSVIPFNMFPRTGHVETVVLLSRKNIDDHLEFMWTDEEFGDHVRTKKVVKKRLTSKFKLRLMAK